MPDLEDIVLDLFDRYAQLEAERRLAQVEAGERTRSEVWESARLMRDMRRLRVDSPRYKAYIDRRATSSKVIQKHRKLLITAIAQSIGKGEQLTQGDLLARQEETVGYSDRHVRGIQNEEIPDVFLPREQVDAGDTRRRSLGTVATPTDLPRGPTSDLADEHLAKDALDTLQDPAVGRSLPLAAIAVMANPHRTERLRAFRKALLREIQAVERAPGVDEDGKHRLNRLRKERGLQEILFNHLESILVSEWFRRHDRDRKIEELTREPGPFLQPDDQERLAEDLARELSDDVEPLDALATVHGVFLANELTAEATVVARSMLDLVDSDRMIAAVLHDNIASAEVREGELDTAVAEYAKAIEGYREHGEIYREAVALASLAEVRYRLDDVEGYQEGAADAEALLHELEEDTERAGLLLNLGTLRAKVGRITEGLDYLDRASEIAPDHQTSSQITSIYLHLIDVPDGRPSEPGVLDWS